MQPAAPSAPDLTIIRDDIRAIQAYAVAAPDWRERGLIKLDAMENPFELPATVARALADRLAQVALNRYPPSDPARFKTRLARAAGAPADVALMIGNGSDELIHLVIQACAKPGAVILAPVPGFVMVELSARFNQCRFVGVPLAADFNLDRAAMLDAIATHRPAVIFIADPNNPTGNLFDTAAIEAIIAAAPGLVVLDEAYLPFAQRTWLPRLAAAPTAAQAGDGTASASLRANCVVLRTVSKLGLAGVRLGYLCGDPAWIAEFDKVRPPYNVNVLTLAAVEFLLDHVDLLDAQAATIRAERTRLLAALRTISGITVFDSAANFILIRVADAAATFAGLTQRSILIKNVSKMHPLLTGCLRISVGLADENDKMLAALADSLPVARDRNAAGRIGASA